MVVDKFSKMVHVMPCTKKTGTTETCRMLELGIFRLHGIPRDMVCDRDARFTSTEFAAWAAAFGIERRFSTSFHPETDGQTERANRVVEEMLRNITAEVGSNWETVLPLLSLPSC